MKNKEMKSNKKLVFRYIVLYPLLMLILSLVLAILINKTPFLNLEIEIADFANCIVAAIATGLVVYQLKLSELEKAEENRIQEHQNYIQEATFILKYNQDFIQDSNMNEVVSLLEQQVFYGRKEPIIDDSNRQMFVNYLVYLEGMAPLIHEGILTIEHIDDLMAYRFFLAVNNPEIQRDQLCRPEFCAYYKGIYKTYKRWADYRRKNSLEILQEETSLEKWELFENNAN